MSFKFKVGNQTPESHEYTRVNTLLASHNLRLCLESKCYQTIKEIGQKLLETSEKVRVNVDDYVIQFCNKVLNKEVEVPFWVTLLVTENKLYVKQRTSLLCSKIDDFFWKIFCYLFSIRIAVFSIKNGELSSSIYGDRRHNQVSILYIDHVYRFLVDYTHKANKVNSDIDYGCLPSKKATAYLHGYAKNQSNILRPNNNIQNTIGQSLINSSVSRLSKLSMIRTNEKTLENVCNQSQNNDSQFKLNPYATYKNLLSNTIKIKEVKLNEIQNDKTSESEPEIENNRKNIHMLQNDYSDTCSQTKETQNKLTRQTIVHNDKDAKCKNGDHKENYSMDKALQFIFDYQNLYQSKLKLYIDNQKHLNEENGSLKQFQQGRLKFYNNESKYGFIVLENNSEVFLHKDNIVKAKIDALGLENCSKFFDIIIEFRSIAYEGKSKRNVKATDVSILNFVPKVNC